MLSYACQFSYRISNSVNPVVPSLGDTKKVPGSIFDGVMMRIESVDRPLGFSALIVKVYG